DGDPLGLADDGIERGGGRGDGRQYRTAWGPGPEPSRSRLEIQGMTVSVSEKLSSQQFGRFREFIYLQSGIRVAVAKITLVSNRIRRRLRAGSFADFDAYYAHLTSPQGAGELEQFLDAITTNETHFFRTPGHFDWFKGDFLTEMIQRRRDSARPPAPSVWAAACTTAP